GRTATLKKVAVAGAGLMGAQIGAEYALAGHDVVLITRSPESAKAALGRAHAAIRGLMAHGLVAVARGEAALPRLRTSTDLMAACADRDVIIESVAEDLGAKADVLDAAARSAPGASLCSNTSSIPIGTLGVAARAPERTLGTHYANPAILMPAVEVIPGARTERRHVETIVGLLRDMGKEPILAPDVPGFLWNRLQFALLREAARLVTEHGVSPEDVDAAVKRGIGRRWSLIGPFETMALGGRETFIKIARMLFTEVGKDVDPEALARIELPAAETLRTLATERDAELMRWRKRDLEAE
ncbi:MAG TPA: 3-hydroxyacyl-CoA dehydrogenase family protein, partial [Planctomycetota bacterium]|nr:3-hydroxyacyl-CoA dehydrogenase family protein [Planctomycetota bacterium]